MDFAHTLSQYFPVPQDPEGFVSSFTLEQHKELKQFFDKFGFVVVRDVVSTEQVNRTLDEIWSCKDDPTRWEKSGVERDNPLTWENPNWQKKFGDIKNGFVNGFSEVELKCSWDNRQHPNIYKLFTLILGRTDLWVKFDRYGLMRPTQNIPLKSSSPSTINKPEWLTVENWLHWDQNPWGQPEFIGVQGLLALSDSTQDTGGFICVPGSKYIMKDWALKNTNDKSYAEFVQIPANDPLKNFAQKITLRKGSFLVWDSRTLHANYANRSSQFRAVQYITYFPALKDEDDENEGDTKKMRAYQVKVWGHEGNYPAPELTELGEKLLGARNWHTNKLECEWKPKPKLFTPTVALIGVSVILASVLFWKFKHVSLPKSSSTDV